MSPVPSPAVNVTLWVKNLIKSDVQALWFYSHRDFICLLTGFGDSWELTRWVERQNTPAITCSQCCGLRQRQTTQHIWVSREGTWSFMSCLLLTLCGCMWWVTTVFSVSFSFAYFDAPIACLSKSWRRKLGMSGASLALRNTTAIQGEEGPLQMPGSGLHEDV